MGVVLEDSIPELIVFSTFRNTHYSRSGSGADCESRAAGTIATSDVAFT
jgi:hypothetical protein